MKTISVFLALSLLISAALAGETDSDVQPFKSNNGRLLRPLAKNRVKAGELQVEELLYHEIESFLVEHWDKNSPRHHQKHVEYAKTVALALNDAPIPRNLKTIKQLSQLLYTGDSTIFGVNNYFISVQNYGRSKGRSVRNVAESLARMKLNKFELFEQLTDVIQFDLKYEVKYFGIHALKNTLSPHLLSTNPILSNINKLLVKKFQRPVNKAVSNLIRVDKEKITFVHPEYELFFAAKYIKEEVQLHSTIRNRIIKTVLGDSKYFKIAEHLDSALGNPREREDFISTLKKISQGSKPFLKISNKVLERVLDNALSFGFDNIAAAVVEKAKESQIKKYFVNKNKASPKIASRGEYKFGMLSTAEETETFERSKMLFKKNMEKTIETLIQVDSKSDKPNKIWLTEKWLNYLEEFFLTQPKPSIKIYNMMKPYIGMKLPAESLSELMFKAVRHGGLWNVPIIINDLLARGVTPAIIIEQGETLVHAAIQNQNPDLLKYVVEDLKVPLVDRPGIKSILSTLLDTNPFPRYSPPRFWEMMKYTMRYGEIEVPQLSQHDQILYKLFTPTSKDKKSLVYTILTVTDDHKVTESIYKLMSSPDSAEIVSRGLKTYRTNSVLSIAKPDLADPVTLTEIVLKYRGLGELMPYEQVVYESCIYLALHYDTNNKVLTPVQQERIIDAILENTGTEGDFKLTKRFVNSPRLQGKFDIDLVRNLRSTLKNYETWKSGNKLPSKRKLLHQTSLRLSVSLSRAELYSEILRPSYKSIVLSIEKTINTVLLASSDSKLMTACDHLF